ncbi:MAG: class II aldolase/adducin family protein [Acidimicrobiales bacterium]
MTELEVSHRELASGVAATANMLAAAGLVEAFGHVSARLAGGGLLITPTTPMPDLTADAVVHVRPTGAVQSPPDAHLPLEMPLHLAIYHARPDVMAICRGHGRSMAAWATHAEPLPLLHGLGLLAGTEVPVHPDLDLITTPSAGDAAAITLGPNQAALLLANGGFAVGASLLEAATRLWYTEERARIALAAPVTRLGDAGEWERRRRHSQAELDRAMAWFLARFGGRSRG